MSFCKLLSKVFLLLLLTGLSQQQERRCPPHDNVDEFLQKPEEFIVDHSQLVNGVDILDLTCLTKKMADNFLEGPLADDRIANLSSCLLSTFENLDSNCYKGYLILCQGITRHIPEKGNRIKCDGSACRKQLRLLNQIAAKFIARGGPDLAEILGGHISNLRKTGKKLACLSKPFVVDPSANKGGLAR